MLKMLTTWTRQRESIRELSRLSDRELADLGIARVDIKAVAMGATFAASEAATPRAETLAPAWALEAPRSLAA